MGNDSKVKVFITGDDEGLKTAENFFDIYNKIFEAAYAKEVLGFENAYRRAQIEEMTHMLYFVDETNVILSSFADEMGGYTLEITVDDLKKVLS
ncbi:MAG: hypothetical protein LUE88_05275 [Clostridiales bacterium]|nr:hypothetical protein [Clostridiales bacterium]